MNLGDGLLFEIENGKPKLIFLSRGSEKNAVKSSRFRAANILSTRQPTCVEEVRGDDRAARPQAGSHRQTKNKAGGAAASFASNAATAGGRRSPTLPATKTHEHVRGGSVKVVAKAKSDRHKRSTAAGSLAACGVAAQPQRSGTQAGGKLGLLQALAGGDSVVCLTKEQLQQILNTVQTASDGQGPPEDHRTLERSCDGNERDLKCGPSVTDGEGEQRKEEGGGGGTDATVSSQEKEDSLSGGLFSWLEERLSESRAAVDAKKAQWRRELDEQVALKQQQRSAPGRLQAEEDTLSALSAQSSISHREQPAAIRSSLRLGEVTPMEEVLSAKRKEEQRRRWLEELNRQREETAERRRREKLLQNQTEDHELWIAHFDSLQRRPPVRTAASSAPPPPGPPHGSERGEWEPSSSLSLVWETMSSCGAESVCGASVDTTSQYPTRASHLRTMTALLDPAQIEERERRRFKQLEQQRAIEAQVEERQRQREREQAKRREEEEEEERRLAQEREILKRRYELDTLKERQKEQHGQQTEPPKNGHGDETRRDTAEPRVTTRGECLEDVVSSASTYRDTAVQTDEAPSVPPTADRAGTPHASAELPPPPPHRRNQTVRRGKENICLPEGGGGGGGGDPYEAFARMERSRKDKRRPEWNTARPSRQFVPASDRYPASLQRNRQESRMRRQAELFALQERTCLSRTHPPPPPPPPPPQHQEPRLCPDLTQSRTSPTRKVQSVSRGHGSSAGVHAERRTVRSQLSSSPPPPGLEFIPYVRTHEVFNLDPLEPADTPPPHSHFAAEAPPAPSRQDPLLHPELLRSTRRQQEILRGLAQLQQSLLQKQRELEADLNPRLKRQDSERR